MKKFVLSDILLFIDHKVAQCNKENYGPCYSQGTSEILTIFNSPD